MKKVLLVLLTASYVLAIYHKEILQSQTALCLDGSPSVIFVEKGDPKRILLHFQSGGWCGQPDLPSTLQSCYQRSLTYLGSSKKLPATINFTEGILSSHEPNIFNNWTRIFLNYCDGSGHQGTRTEPVKYKNTSLYFRGVNITLERFEYLEQKYKLYSGADEVVLSGASAGGLATYFWANYLLSKMQKGRLRAIADSGVFLNSYNFTTGKYDYRDSFKALQKLSNQQIDPPNEVCVANNPNQKELCMFAENIIDQIKVPIFVVQSLYDSWSIQYVLGIKCAGRESLSTCSKEQVTYIEEYHRNTSQVMHKVKNLKGLNGYWANGCVFHGYTFFQSYNMVSFQTPTNSGETIDHSITSWLAGAQQNHYHEDLQNWPSNKGCSNVKSLNLVNE